MEVLGALPAEIFRNTTFKSVDFGGYQELSTSWCLSVFGGKEVPDNFSSVLCESNGWPRRQVEGRGSTPPPAVRPWSRCWRYQLFSDSRRWWTEVWWCGTRTSRARQASRMRHGVDCEITRRCRRIIYFLIPLSRFHNRASTFCMPRTARNFFLHCLQILRRTIYPTKLISDVKN